MAGDQAVPEHAPPGLEHLWFNVPPRQRPQVYPEKQAIFDELDALSPRATLTSRIRRLERALNLPESSINEVPSDELPAAIGTMSSMRIEVNNQIRFVRVPPSMMGQLTRYRGISEIGSLLTEAIQQLQDDPTKAPPGWHPDPWQLHAMRWWDGKQWTGWTHDHSQTT
jgi:hypothetical protein